MICRFRSSAITGVLNFTTLQTHELNLPPIEEYKNSTFYAEINDQNGSIWPTDEHIAEFHNPILSPFLWLNLNVSKKHPLSS
jgi:hypothetical protein